MQTLLSGSLGIMHHRLYCAYSTSTSLKPWDGQAAFNLVLELFVIQSNTCSQPRTRNSLPEKTRTFPPGSAIACFWSFIWWKLIVLLTASKCNLQKVEIRHLPVQRKRVLLMRLVGMFGGIADQIIIVVYACYPLPYHRFKAHLMCQNTIDQ